MLSRLTHYTAVGTYHVVVTGKDAGNYVLDIELLPAQPTLTPTVTVQPGGCGPLLTVRQTVGGLRTETCVLGSAFYLDANNLPASTVVLKVIGTETLASPFDLGAWGAPGCFLEVQPIDQAPDTSSANGDFYWSLRTPMALWLIGLTIEQQLAVIDIGANPLNMTITNRVSSVCGISNQ
jgi:hypothetical protein